MILDTVHAVGLLVLYTVPAVGLLVNLFLLAGSCTDECTSMAEVN